MQSAKDSFYVILRNRIAAANAARTVTIRGISRPGVLVVENELETATSAMDVFSLRWSEMSVDGSDGLIRMRCEISYATGGTTGNGGMDRGWLLSGMDAEIAAALRLDPQSTSDTQYSSEGETALETYVFWADPVFGKATADGERVSRTATVEVFGYQEAGEL